MRLCLSLLLATSALSLVGGAAAPPPAPSGVEGPLTADQIARRVQDRDTGRDSRGEMRMKLFDRRERVRERALTLVTLRGREAPGAPKTAPDGDRLLIRFTYPNDIRGTSFLVWKHPQGEDERFLFLPSLGRVRRIAGSEAQESFVGSDFSYEDIGGRELEDFTYALLDETSSWTSPDGVAHPAYRLESKRKDRSAEFPRVVSLVLKETFVVVHADVYNRRDEKQKTYSVKRLEAVQGIWTVMQSSMANGLDKTRTDLVIEKMEYNIGLKEDAFSRRALEDAPRQGSGRAGK
jgi:Outer membrane lipoprotein-sorting protein